MNKLISRKTAVFISFVGPSETAKAQFVYKWLKNGTFQPRFEKLYSFYQHSQTLYDVMQKEIENLQFVRGVNLEYIDSLNYNGARNLLIFDDSCGEICTSKAFVDIATADRHRGLSTVYIKRNLFHQSTLGETLSSRTRILFSSSLPMMWCKSLRLVDNWDSIQS